MIMFAETTPQVKFLALELLPYCVKVKGTQYIVLKPYLRMYAVTYLFL